MCVNTQSLISHSKIITDLYDIRASDTFESAADTASWSPCWEVFLQTNKYIIWKRRYEVLLNIFVNSDSDRYSLVFIKCIQKQGGKGKVFNTAGRNSISSSPLPYCPSSQELGITVGQPPSSYNREKKPHWSEMEYPQQNLTTSTHATILGL